MPGVQQHYIILLLLVLYFVYVDVMVPDKFSIKNNILLVYMMIKNVGFATLYIYFVVRNIAQCWRLSTQQPTINAAFLDPQRYKLKY